VAALCAMTPVLRADDEGAAGKRVAPHLRGPMPSVGLRAFQTTVSRQWAVAPKSYLIEGQGKGNVVALTFDDGPDPQMTPRLLGILKEHGAVATFFLVGSRIQSYPDTVAKIREAGHAVAGHGFEHIDHRDLSAEEAFETQFAVTDGLVQQHAGSAAGYFRPPYGALTDEQVEYFARRGVEMVLWSVDSLDWSTSHNRAAKIEKRVLDQVHPGAVVLLHSGRARRATAKALPRILKELSRRGYRFVTVEEMFDLQRKRASQVPAPAPAPAPSKP